jgi:hypothetical protein
VAKLITNFIYNEYSFIYFSPHCLGDIQQIINIFSTQLQQKIITLDKADLVIESLMNMLDEKRSDKCFSGV